MLRTANWCLFYGSSAVPLLQDDKLSRSQVKLDVERAVRADLDAEDLTITEYRKRIRQAQALGEYALAEILQEIIKQEQDHQIELASALGIVPDPRGRTEKSPFAT